MLNGEFKEQLVNSWKQIASERKNDRYLYIVYVTIRGFLNGQQPDHILEKYIKPAFTPVTSKTKIASGRFPGDTLCRSLPAPSPYLHDSLVTSAFLARVMWELDIDQDIQKKIIPALQHYLYQMNDSLNIKQPMSKVA